MSSVSEEMAANLAMVRERIELAASRSGRRAEEITLVAVSKTHPVERIRELYEAGVRHFGENRIQEWEEKRPRLAALDATWHMIGHVQKNKAARAAHLFDCVDSVDSLGLAEKLDRARVETCAKEGKTSSANAVSSPLEPGDRLRVLIEVRLDPEPSKSGVDEQDVSRLAESILRLPHLELRGLMGIPPYFDDPEQTRPFFRRLHELRDATQNQLGMYVLPVLSMGMTHDFEIAIEEGATQIRVGTAIFGERQPER
jgi:pyridoxal phosphate enzyme (YggS family)